jgi:hypothetical protein
MSKTIIVLDPEFWKNRRLTPKTEFDTTEEMINALYTVARIPNHPDKKYADKVIDKLWEKAFKSSPLLSGTKGKKKKAKITPEIVMFT